jgi:hypothetical protein
MDTVLTTSRHGQPALWWPYDFVHGALILAEKLVKVRAALSCQLAPPPPIFSRIIAMTTSISTRNLIIYCNQSDPLNESWLWAQTIGLALAIAVTICTLLSACNCIVISYSLIMARLSLMDLDPSSFAPWQEYSSTCAISTGVIIATLAVILRLWLRASYGPAVIKRRLRLALTPEEAARLCLSLLPEGCRQNTSTSKKGLPTMHVLLSHSALCSRHLLIRVIPEDSGETSVLIDVVPVLNGPFSLLSAFICDSGHNKAQAAMIIASLKAHMSQRRQGVESQPKVSRKFLPAGEPDCNLAYEQVLSTTPANFFYARPSVEEQRCHS